MVTTLYGNASQSKAKKARTTRPLYSAKNDPTLTARQAEIGGFRPDAYKTVLGEYRGKSNKTLGGYSSGYHELAVTTSSMKFLRNATTSGRGMSVLPSTSSHDFFRDYYGKKVNSEALGWVLRSGDGFRSDTAQTIMSGPNGKAAGHTGSGVDTTGQDAAHVLLRVKIMDLLDPKLKNTPGFTERALTTILASISISSVAPGEVARTVSGGTGFLKAGEKAKRDWEVNRNEAKNRVQHLFDALDEDEQRFVRAHAGDFLFSTQGGAKNGPRKLGPGRSTSPPRVTTGPSDRGKDVQGGGYLRGQSATAAPRQMGDVALKGQSLWATQPFRNPRRVPGSM